MKATGNKYERNVFVSQRETRTSIMKAPTSIIKEKSKKEEEFIYSHTKGIIST